MFSRKKFVFGATLAAGMLASALIVPASALAYNIESGCGSGWHAIHSESVFSFTNNASNPAYTAFNTAAGEWTGTPTKVILQNTGGPGIITSNPDSGNTGYDGITYYSCSSGYFTNGVRVQVNSYYTAGYSTNERVSVTTHEFGHALGLAHNNPSTCSGRPVMYYATPGRYTQCGIYTPQTDDINGINHIYGSP
jgi:hypothetical protein